jgi:hypothetical protein
MTTCDKCGAAVADSIQHASWHSEQFRFRMTVASALAALAHEGDDAKLRAGEVDEANKQLMLKGRRQPI